MIKLQQDWRSSRSPLPCHRPRKRTIQQSEMIVTGRAVTAYWMHRRSLSWLAEGETRWRGTTKSLGEFQRRSLLSLLVHRKHALRHQKAAENIHGCESQRDEAEAARPGPAAADHGDADREQRTDHDHRGDCVGHRHQRGMQRRRHRPHHEIADEYGEYENRKPEHEGIDGLRDKAHGGAADALRL